MSNESEERRLERLTSGAEYAFSVGDEDPFEYTDMTREEFANQVRRIMANREMVPAEKHAEIDTLLYRVCKSAAQKLGQQKYDAGEDPDEDERIWAEEQKHRGRIEL